MAAHEPDLHRLQSELTEVKKERKESGMQLQDLKLKVVQLQELGDKMLSDAESALANEGDVARIKEVKDCYYLMTGIDWSKPLGNPNIIKGFVINDVKKDVHTFKFDRREIDPNQSCNILWDYIGAGISQPWNEI